jgi:hypothetical protein
MSHLCPFIVRYIYAFKISLLSCWLASSLSLPHLPHRDEKRDVNRKLFSRVIFVIVVRISLLMDWQQSYKLTCPLCICNLHYLSFAAWRVFRGIVVLFSIHSLYRAYHYLSATVNFSSSVSLVFRLRVVLRGNRNLSCSPLSRADFKNMWITTPALLYIFMSHSAKLSTGTIVPYLLPSVYLLSTL